jgi:hypothetical protein
LAPRKSWRNRFQQRADGADADDEQKRNTKHERTIMLSQNTKGLQIEQP